jgi:hypothetical protein
VLGLDVGLGSRGLYLGLMFLHYVRTRQMNARLSELGGIDDFMITQTRNEME